MKRIQVDFIMKGSIQVDSMNDAEAYELIQEMENTKLAKHVDDVEFSPPEIVADYKE